jgi:hypothetical protein
MLAHQTFSQVVPGVRPVPVVALTISTISPSSRSVQTKGVAPQLECFLSTRLARQRITARRRHADKMSVGA